MIAYSRKIKRKIFAAFLIILVAVLTIPAHAAGPEEIAAEQENAAGVDRLKRSARQLGGTAEYGDSLEDGLSKLLKDGIGIVGTAARTAISSGLSILIVVFFCGVGETVYQTADSKKQSFIPLAGAVAVAAVAIADVDSMLGLGRNSIETMASFANVLLPVIASVTAATGAVTGAAVRQMAAVLFSDLLINLIQRLLIPLLYGYMAVSIAGAAIGNEGLKKIGGFLKWLTTTMLTTVMLAFVGYLTVSGVVAGSADAMTIKATKFAISSAIPVVGGILSDAAETILVSTGILRGSVGVFGMVTILGMCLAPLLRMAVHYLAYKLVGAVSSTVSAGALSTLVDQLGSAFGLMMGMTGACCLLLLVSLVSSITAVSI